MSTGEWKFLNDKHHEVSNFYGLPKIHKSKVIESAIKTQNSEIIEIFEPNGLKLRPIVGGPKFPTRKLSQSIDILIESFLQHIKSFIFDSLCFIIKCPSEVDEDTEIVTFDVISLYTSIPHEFDLEVLDYFLTAHQEDLHPRFKKEFVLESANFILKNNSLTFDSEFYLKMKGTGMSTISAPTYANLTIGYHKIKVCSIIRQSYALASKYFENSWFRFLDDCQILLKVNLIKPDQLLSILNQINNNIQFTMEKSDKQKWYKNLDGHLQQTNRLKTKCPIYVKPRTAFFNKYTVLSCKKNMYHC